MYTVGSSEKSVDFHKTTWHDTPEGNTSHLQFTYFLDAKNLVSQEYKELLSPTYQCTVTVQSPFAFTLYLFFLF
jgi:hypothetical protein